MKTMHILTMVTLDWIWTVQFFGIIIGPAFILVWFIVLKVNSGGIFEGKNTLPTLVLAPTGIASILLSGYFYLSNDPWRSQIYVVNHATQSGYIELDGQRFLVDAGAWEEISLRTHKSTYSAKGYIGDSIVFDTIIGEGAYMSLLGGNKYLLVREWVYSKNLDDVDIDDLVYDLLEEPGMLRFSEDVDPKVYDFDEEAPASISTERHSSDKHAFDLSILNEAQRMQEYYKYILSSGMDYDSLMEELTAEPVDVDSTMIDE